MTTWKEYNINGLNVTLRFNSNTRRWLIWVGRTTTATPDGSLRGRDPDIELTRTKGDAVVETLTEIHEALKNDRVPA